MCPTEKKPAFQVLCKLAVLVYMPFCMQMKTCFTHGLELATALSSS